MPLRGSASYVVGVVLVVMFIVGALLLTVVDPMIQGLFDSSLWSSTTTYGKNILGNMALFSTYFGLILLSGFLSFTWIHTRRAG